MEYDFLSTIYSRKFGRSDAEKKPFAHQPFAKQGRCIKFFSSNNTTDKVNFSHHLFPYLIIKCSSLHLCIHFKPDRGRPVRPAGGTAGPMKLPLKIHSIPSVRFDPSCDRFKFQCPSHADLPVPGGGSCCQCGRRVHQARARPGQRAGPGRGLNGSR
jgi:hypothetical protein